MMMPPDHGGGALVAIGFWNSSGYSMMLPTYSVAPWSSPSKSSSMIWPWAARVVPLRSSATVVATVIAALATDATAIRPIAADAAVSVRSFIDFPQQMQPHTLGPRHQA